MIFKGLSSQSKEFLSDQFGRLSMSRKAAWFLIVIFATGYATCIAVWLFRGETVAIKGLNDTMAMLIATIFLGKGGEKFVDAIKNKNGKKDKNNDPANSSSSRVNTVG